MSNKLVYMDDVLNALKGKCPTVAVYRVIRDIPEAVFMPEYIDNVLVVRHYCNGMVAMNEECYKRMQSVDPITTEEAIEHLQECGWLPEHDRILTESKSGEWEEKETFCVADDDPIISQWQSARCSECGKYHTTPYMYYFDNYNFCPHCGAKMSNASNASNTLEPLERGETE